MLMRTKHNKLLCVLGEIVGTGSSQALFESNPVIVTFQSPADDVVVSAEKFALKKMVKNLMLNHKLLLKRNQVM